jgi:uncharacterized membrane protein YgaE (UPF0421/DUF939 family)
MTRRGRRRERRGPQRRSRGAAAARIASGAVVGLGLGLMISGVFGLEYVVYAVVAGVVLGAALATLVERRRGGGAA